MSEHELEKLLGGFAADTLTAEERKLLHTAALQDQQLFNALADEQALKELLADPVVRRRLLQGLKQTSTSSAGGSLSWLDWFRRPASLAFAGGLAAAIFAVVLGTKVYQDSLRQTTLSVATEESKPSTPPSPSASESAPTSIAEPQPKAKANAEPEKEGAKKDALLDKMAKRERTTPRQEPRASDVAHDGLKQRREQDEVRRQAGAPVAALSKKAEEVTASADQNLAASSSPAAAAPEPRPMEAPPGGLIAGAVAPAVSARALFYGESAARPDGRAKAQEKERAMKPLAESAPQANRPERKVDRFAAADKAAGVVTQFKPLGLRYSFVIRGIDGQDREVDLATALNSEDPIRLTLEANQSAYIRVLKTAVTRPKRLLIPTEPPIQPTIKISGGTRYDVLLPVLKNSKWLALTVQLSREPFVQEQEPEAAGIPPSSQLAESTSAVGVTGSQELATYVVSQDSSSVQLSIQIPVSAP